MSPLVRRDHIPITVKDSPALNERLKHDPKKISTSYESIQVESSSWAPSWRTDRY
jgi:hypothetical protein